jgi:menaquinone reductase, molybdopterin-binding-like subunit
MEFSRRNFIKFVAGGAAGTMLSPLPWKLIDDIAIWTQNWSWVPVPAKGRFSTIDTVCTLCPGGCGIEVKKIGERVVKIHGRKGFPVNNGAICPVGAAGQQILYNEGIRWQTPMKRIGSRGSKQWKEISWPRAIEEIASNISSLRAKGTPEKLAAIDGNSSRSTMALLIKRFVHAIGSPNYLATPSEEDTYSMVLRIMQGSKGPAAFDLENADFILSFGCGLLDGWGAPGRMSNAWGYWSADKNVKPFIVQVEPRLSNTGSKANIWLAPKPGTESALALGIAHVIIREGLFNKEFIGEHAFGFRNWVDEGENKHKGFSTIVMEKYTPQAVEKITGIESKEIINVARKFASANRPIALAGRGKGILPGSLYDFMCIHSLNALAGRINMKGGVLAPDELPLAKWPDVKYDSVATDGAGKERIDKAGGDKYPFAESLINKFAQAVNDGTSAVETLLIFSSNPAYTTPDTKDFINALDKIPFIVSFSPFIDETSLFADLILPDHTHLEKVTDTAWPTGLQYPAYTLSRPVIKPLYHTRHSGDVVVSLAKKIGGSVGDSFIWDDFEHALKDRVKGIYESGRGEISSNTEVSPWKNLNAVHVAKKTYTSFDSMWKELTQSGCWFEPAHPFGNWSNIFQTKSKKFEFFSTDIDNALKCYADKRPVQEMLANLGIGSSGDEVNMPHYEEKGAGGKKGNSGIVFLPFEIINLASGWVGNPPFLNKTLFENQLKRDDIFAEINPKTASQYGLKEGSKITIRSSKGEIRARVHIFDGARPGIIFVPAGLGHTAYDNYLKGKGANPFDIIDISEDPLTGNPVWWNTRVEIVKI